MRPFCRELRNTAEHHGLHWLCDYEMTLAPDTTLVRNPQRTTALATLRAHERTVAELE